MSRKLKGPQRNDEIIFRDHSHNNNDVLFTYNECNHFGKLVFENFVRYMKKTDCIFTRIKKKYTIYLSRSLINIVYRNHQIAA